MGKDLLKFLAFCAYLAAWIVFAIAAAVGAIPRLTKQAADPNARMPFQVFIGTALQCAAFFLVTRSMLDGPLRPGRLALAGVLALAPMGAALFVWALRSAPSDATQLATGGAYAALRHPIYLAFFAMLLATGLVLSSGIKLILPVVLYLGGSELRIDSEEDELVAKFPETYGEYRQRTRWRYLPGFR